MEQTNRKAIKAKLDCPSIEIAAYLDGELTPDEELGLEMHLVSCHVCSQELNVQKQIVNVLSGSLDALELPKDFAKVVVTSAESSVSGLRNNGERTSAMIVCAALFIVVMFTLGAAAPGAFTGFFNAATGVYAVAMFVFHFVFDVAEGITILLRAFLSQPNSSTSLALTAVLVACGAGYFFVHSRSNSHKDRIKGESLS